MGTLLSLAKRHRQQRAWTSPPSSNAISPTPPEGSHESRPAPPNVSGPESAAAHPARSGSPDPRPQNPGSARSTYPPSAASSSTPQQSHSSSAPRRTTTLSAP